MTQRAEVITYSVSEETGKEAVTFKLYYPRIILAELNTHGMLAKNSSSSRAIPVKRMIEALRADPFIPVHWGKNQKGMQADEELDPGTIAFLEDVWLEQMEHSIGIVEYLIEQGLHKQIANRLLEPWGHMNTVLTGTEFNNLWALRRHKDAQPEFKALADAMYEAKEAATPTVLKRHEWHLPFITPKDWRDIKNSITMNGVLRIEPTYEQMLEKAIMLSVARCASVSYETVEGKPFTLDRAQEVYNKLLNSQPLHASPAEHQLTPDWYNDVGYNINGRSVVEPLDWANPHLHGRTRGYIQYRKTLANEYVPG